MPPPQHVFLIPGFFGFDNLGDLAYFAHAREALLDWCRRAGVDVYVHTVSTLPTASLRQRARTVVNRMSEVLSAAGDQAGRCTWWATPAAAWTPAWWSPPTCSCPRALAAEPLAARVQTVVTLATPHYGTPLAAFFSSLLGAQLLQVLSVATSYVLRTGPAARRRAGPAGRLLRAAAPPGGAAGRSAGSWTPARPHPGGLRPRAPGRARRASPS